MSYIIGNIGFALDEKVVDTSTATPVVALQVSPSAVDNAPSLEEEECARFQAALADAGLYDGPIDGDLFRVADIRNELRAEHGFALVSSNTSITQADFAALEREVSAMQYGEGPPPAIIPEAPTPQAAAAAAAAASTGKPSLLVPGLLAAAFLLL